MDLKELLKAVLPKDEVFEVLNLRNVPIESHPLVTTKPDSKVRTSLTIKTQHIFVLFHQQRVIFGLEIYVYLTLNPTSSSIYNAERTIFISKADTTGYASCRVSYRDITKAVIRYLLSLDPNCYLRRVIPKERNYSCIDPSLITKNTSAEKALRILSNRLKNGTKISEERLKQQLTNSYQCSSDVVTKLCLFTRPAPQYLFPDSSKNEKKHVANGEKLLKWWIAILDELLVEDFRDDTEARIRIPGEDPLKVKRYIRSAKYDHWQPGDIFGSNGSDLAAFQLPLFPDDPKTRFLHQLAEEDRTSKANLDAFWTELQERQEFKLSVIVSVIGLKGYLAMAPSNLPSPVDQFEAPSRKQFRNVKNYITGEDYDREGGAIEAYQNVRDYMNIKFERALLKITGNRKLVREPKNIGRGEVVTTLQVRKRPKKN